MKMFAGLLLAALLSTEAIAESIAVVPVEGELQSAIDRAVSGDVLNLPAGVYREPLVIDGKVLTLLGDPSGGTILTGGLDGASPAAGATAALVTLRRGARAIFDHVTLEATRDCPRGVVVEGSDTPIEWVLPTAPGPLATYEITLSNGCLIGPGLPGSVGFLLTAGGTPVNALLQNMIVRDWDIGLRPVGVLALITVTNSALTPNLTAAFDNSAGGGAQDARYNWWGHASGPGGVGPGSGDAVVGAGVTFLPWRLSGVDAIPGCGFNPPPDNVVTPGPADTCLSTANPCVTIPVTIARFDNAPVRGFSVTLQLSPELALCVGPSSITEGTYLTNVNPGTNFQVIDNGGGSYTVDGAILGLPCGATAVTGTLFYVRIRNTVPSGTGTITVTTVLLRDCDNVPVPGSPGAPLSVTIDAVPLPPVTALTASQIKSGNDTDGTTKIQLLFTLPGGATAVKVYRARFGNYPEYDDAPGAGAPPPVVPWPPGPPWTLTAVTASGQSDEVVTRDFWYYVAYAVDACGNVSAPSARTAGTLNYHLGDFHNGVTNCAGENLVTTADLSFLGSNYGASLAPSDPLGCLDIGPTADFGVDTLPTTDNILDFEDLIVLALNFGIVSRPWVGTIDPSGDNAIWLDMPAGGQAGDLVDLVISMRAAGDICGLSLSLDFDPVALVPVRTTSGELLVRQGATSVVLSSSPEVVDVALLGGVGLRGEGELLRVTFRLLSPQAAAPRLAGLMARDARNRPVTPGVIHRRADDPGPTALTRVGLPVPNPFRSTSEIRLELRVPGRVRVDIFDLQGRRVRQLRDGALPAGPVTATWDGRADSGLPASSGWYLVRLETEDGVFNRSLRLVR